MLSRLFSFYRAHLCPSSLFIGGAKHVNKIFQQFPVDEDTTGCLVNPREALFAWS